MYIGPQGMKFNPETSGLGLADHSKSCLLATVFIF